VCVHGVTRRNTCTRVFIRSLDESMRETPVITMHQAIRTCCGGAPRPPCDRSCTSATHFDWECMQRSCSADSETSQNHSAMKVAMHGTRRRRVLPPCERCSECKATCIWQCTCFRGACEVHACSCGSCSMCTNMAKCAHDRSCVQTGACEWHNPPNAHTGNGQESSPSHSHPFL
jgi:hypothetical protein